MPRIYNANGNKDIDTDTIVKVNGNKPVKAPLYEGLNLAEKSLQNLADFMVA